MAAQKKKVAPTKNTNWFAIWVSVAVVVVLVGLGALVVVLNNQATAPGPAPVSKSVNKETGAIAFGDGKDVIDTYVDFMCPNCRAFETEFGEKLQKAAAENKITLNIHPVSVLDRASQGTKYPTRAAGAMYCVAEKTPDASLKFFNSLFENQPDEGTEGLSNAELASYAVAAGATDAADCIAKGTYMDYVTDQTRERKIEGTPTVEINGKRLNTKAGELSELVDILG